MPEIENLNELVDNIFIELNEIRLGDKDAESNPTRRIINDSVLELRCLSDTNDYALFMDDNKVVNFQVKNSPHLLYDQNLKLRYLAALLSFGYVSHDELWNSHEKVDERGFMDLPDYPIVHVYVSTLKRDLGMHLPIKSRKARKGRNGGIYVGDLEEHRQEDVIEYKDENSERKYRLNTTTGMVWMPDQMEGRKNRNLIPLNATYPFEILELMVKRGGSVSIKQINTGVYGGDAITPNKQINIRTQISHLNILLGGHEWRYVIGTGDCSRGSRYQLLFEPVPRNTLKPTS